MAEDTGVSHVSGVPGTPGNPSAYRPVNLSPSAMSDGVADWPLDRVMEHLKKKEKEKDAQSLHHDTRMGYRSCIRLLRSAITESAVRYGVSTSRMMRCLTYHGVAIADDDTLMSGLSASYVQLNRMGLESGDSDTLDMLDAIVPYSPKSFEDRAGMVSLYEPWVAARFRELGQVCGVFAYRVIQVFMMRSLMTSDIAIMPGLQAGFTAESTRWDRWMTMRLGAIQAMVEHSPFGVTLAEGH